MTRDAALKLLVQVTGLVTLLAAIGLLMPESSMASTHQWLGLGEFPDAPIVQYLARYTSASYVLFGALCLFLAADLQRYRPLLRFLGAAVLLFAAALIGIDLAAGMPSWWTVSEGASTIIFGALMYVLARP